MCVCAGAGVVPRGGVARGQQRALHHSHQSHSGGAAAGPELLHRGEFASILIRHEIY